MAQESLGCDPDLLGRLLAGQLSPDQEASVERHLGVCAACREALEARAAGRAWWNELQRLGDSKGDSGPDVPGELDGPLGFLEPSDSPGSLGRLGPYEVTGTLGRGGMGIVLRAFDPTLQRPVAIKVITPALATSAAARRRFAREARAAAAVSHDHIVAIHAVAESTHGLPYLVMPYIAGRSLQQRLDDSGPLAVVEILRIGMQAAAGLAAAHAQGLVHRDIKPANILLENGVERVKITDFGLARAADDASLSHSSVIIGTPQYMAPEQAEGEAIDPRADLFSLGSVLYTVATGHSPFRAKTNMAVLRRVCQDQPRPIREINPEIPDWLAAIIAKLQAKNPADRFQSASEVADLLGRCLAYLERPAGSAPPFPPDSEARIARRKRPSLLAATAIGLVLAALGMAEARGVSPILNSIATVLRILTPEGTLVVEVDDPEVTVQIDGEHLLIHGAGPKEIRLKVGQHRVSAIKDGKPVHEQIVTITRERKRTVAVRFEPNQPEAHAAKATDQAGLMPELPGLPGSRLQAREKPGMIVEPYNTIPGPPTTYEPKAALVPAGPEIPGAGPDELLRPVPLSDRSPVPLWPGNAITFMAYAPDGKLLAMASNLDRKIVLFDVPSRRILKRLEGHHARIMELVFSPDGKRLAAATGHFGSTPASGEVWLWDLTKPDEPGVRVATGIPMVFTVAFSPDGKTLAYGGWDDTVTLHDLASRTDRAVCRGHEESVRSIAFSPDGKILASGSWDHTVRLWDPETGKPIGDPFPPLLNRVNTVAFSPDGTLLAAHVLDTLAPSGDRAKGPEILVWDVATRRERASLRTGHARYIFHIAFAPDGKTLASAGGATNKTGEVILWDTKTWTVRETLRGFPTNVECLAFSPDGKTLMAESNHKGVRSEIRVWELSTPLESARELPAPIKPVSEFRIDGDADHRAIWAIAFSPDGQSLAAGTGKWFQHGKLWVWDLASGRGRAAHRAYLGIRAIAYSPDGKRLALGAFGGTLTLCKPDGQEPIELKGHSQDVNAVAFSPDGKFLASASSDCSVILRDAESGRLLRILGPCNAEPWSLIFRPDGERLVVGGKDGGIAFLDPATGESVMTVRGHSLGVSSLTYSPGDRRLVSGSWDKTLRIWASDPSKIDAGTILEGHEHAIKSVAFSPDGRWLASGDGAEDGSKAAGVLRVWDVAGRSLRVKLTGHTGRIWSVAFSPDGQRLASADDDGVIKLWDLTAIGLATP